MNLKTQYLGLDLKHPVVASPSPIAQRLDGIKSLEDSGAAAVILPSLFEEQIRYENESFAYFRQVSSNTFPESLTFFPTPREEFEAGPDEYLELIRRAREATSIPILASLNATSPGGWTEFALQVQDAGASAIELNAYFIPEFHQSSQMVEQRYVDIVGRVHWSVRIPIAVKLMPYFSSMGEMAQRLVKAGAKGLVLFNRLYQPDFDLESREVVPTLELSRPGEMRLPLLWIANLHGRVSCSLAATTGVYSGTDVAKYVLAGADVAMTTSALLKHGAKHIASIVRQLDAWGDRNEYESVAQMRGAMSKRNVGDPSAFDRSNYIKVLQNYIPKHAMS